MVPEEILLGLSHILTEVYTGECFLLGGEYLRTRIGNFKSVVSTFCVRGRAESVLFVRVLR
jgi:hypothetical protein